MNPDDTQRLLRIVNTPKRGIGATSLQRLQAHAAERGGEPVDGAARRRRRARAVARRRQRPAGASRGSSRACRPALAGRPVAEVVRSVLDESGYEAALKAQKTLESEGRLENLEEFVGVAAEYDKRADEPSLDGFLQEISLYSRHRRASPTRARCSRS